MSSSQSNSSNNKKHGVDTLLTLHGKRLKIGEEIRFVLVKGGGGSSQTAQADPVNPKAPPETFPLVAKFPESVVRPDFSSAPWKTARFYQQDAPKAEEDSEDEAEATSAVQPKKRWRPRRKEAPKRQWVLQEQVDFLETLMAKRQHKELPKEETSSKYVGIPEHNPSQFALIEAAATTTSPTDDNAMDTSDDFATSTTNRLQVTLLPTPNATIAFSQPKARKTLSMSQAEQAILDQRGKTSRYMMHANGKAAATATAKKKDDSRKRLFGKLAAVQKRSTNEDDDEDDDVMGDLTFRNRKGTGGKARKELLNTLGDSTVKVDADGVLGGANDGEFGRGQRFGRFKADQQQPEADGGGAKDDTNGDAAGTGPTNKEPSTKGNDGLAMADDFYQRDVQAEYEELDYDANEQFDDDDVDVGETEMVQDGGG